MKKKIIPPYRLETKPFGMVSKRYTTVLLCLFVQCEMSDIEYQKKIYSYFQYNVGLRSLGPISDVPTSGSV
jgi:hypothetical protein